MATQMFAPTIAGVHHDPPVGESLLDVVDPGLVDEAELRPNDLSKAAEMNVIVRLPLITYNAESLEVREDAHTLSSRKRLPRRIIEYGMVHVSLHTANIHQQLVFRPVPGLARPETPVDGVYLASASAHPGGGVHGAPGANAARAALGRSRWTGGMRRRALDAVQRRIYR